MLSSPVKWILFLLLGLLVVVSAAAGVVIYEARSFRASDLIARNVTLSGVPVGQLRSADAIDKLTEQWLPSLPQEIKLTHGKRSFEVLAEELGRQPQIEQAVAAAMKLGREQSLLAQLATHVRLMKSTVDLPVKVEVDKTLAEEQIAQIAGQLDRDPVNARITVTGGESVDVIPGKPGLKVDRKATLAAVEKALQTLHEDTVPLVVGEKQPPITAKDLAHLEVVLGTYATPYSSGKVDRSYNLKLAVEAINGKIVMPGEVFSTDQAIGPRSTERGFREAPIFADGEITPATGGGICQIATTVYNAALFAGLPIVERHHHSQPVTYAPAGRDATVYSGQYDLRFRNTTGHPIVVLGSLTGSRVVVNIVGKREANKKVRLERTGLKTLANAKKEIPDPNLPIGKKEVEEPGRAGITVTLHRIITSPDGTEKRETLHTDTYRPQTRVVRVGTKLPEIPKGPDGKPLPVKRGPDGKPLVGPDGKAIVIKTPQKPAAKPGATAAPTTGGKTTTATSAAKPSSKPAAKPPAKPAPKKPRTAN